VRADNFLRVAQTAAVATKNRLPPSGTLQALPLMQDRSASSTISWNARPDHTFGHLPLPDPLADRRLTPEKRKDWWNAANGQDGLETAESWLRRARAECTIGS